MKFLANSKKSMVAVALEIMIQPLTSISQNDTFLQYVVFAIVEHVAKYCNLKDQLRCAKWD